MQVHNIAIVVILHSCFLINLGGGLLLGLLRDAFIMLHPVIIIIPFSPIKIGAFTPLDSPRTLLFGFMVSFESIRYLKEKANTYTKKSVYA